MMQRMVTDARAHGCLNPTRFIGMDHRASRCLYKLALLRGVSATYWNRTAHVRQRLVVSITVTLIVEPPSQARHRQHFGHVYRFTVVPTARQSEQTCSVAEGGHINHVIETGAKDPSVARGSRCISGI